MADTKIMGLVGNGACVDDDNIPFVDVSDTTMDADGSTRRITVGNLRKQIVGPLVTDFGAADWTVPYPLIHGAIFFWTSDSSTSYYIKLPDGMSAPVTGTRFTVVVIPTSGTQPYMNIEDNSDTSLLTGITNLTSDMPMQVEFIHLGSNKWSLRAAFGADNVVQG